MYTVIATRKFKKDLKLCLKRGLDESKFDEVVLFLANEGKLPQNLKPHKLKGKYNGLWESLGMSYSTRLVVDLGTRRRNPADFLD